MYDKLKQFIATVNRANLRGETSIRLTIADANEIENDISKVIIRTKRQG